MKSKFTAGILCLLLGGLGIHEFYLGDTKKGVLYIIACVICLITGVGAILFILFQIGVAIHYMTMDQAKFDAKYNGIRPGTNAAYNPKPSVTFKPNIINPMAENNNEEHEVAPKEKTKFEMLKDLKLLLDEGLITNQEFEAKKKIILNS